MTRIVTTHYRYKRPPRKRKAVALDVPAAVTRASKRSEPQAAAAPPANDDRKSAVATSKRACKDAAWVDDGQEAPPEIKTFLMRPAGRLRSKLSQSGKGAVMSNRRMVLLGSLSLLAACGASRPGRTGGITGATINGTPHPPDTLANLIAATPSGGTLVLPTGTWSGTAAIGTACTIKGAGMGQTIIDATGVSLTRGKGIFVPMVAGVAFADMTLTGAAVSDLNGAGIREDGPGLGWTATNVEFTGNQDGILTFASNITLNNCSFHNNGAHDQHSHENYFNGSPATQVTLNNVTSVAGTGSTHALKSRAGTTRVVGGSYAGNP